MKELFRKGQEYLARWHGQMGQSHWVPLLSSLTEAVSPRGHSKLMDGCVVLRDASVVQERVYTWGRWAGSIPRMLDLSHRNFLGQTQATEVGRWERSRGLTPSSGPGS